MPTPLYPETIRRRQFLGGGAAILLSLPAVRARADSRQIILKITYSTGKSLALSDADLAALPWHNLRTHTFWTDGVQEFRGPSLRDVMALGTEAETLRGKTFRMKALNEFSVEVPADDMFDSNPLLAREMNGRPMQVRDKGPLWLVYPRDDRPDLQNPVYDDRWIWQLNDIKVL